MKPFDITLELAEKLAAKFTAVKIKKTDLDAAERKMRGELISKWDEKVNKDFLIFFSFIFFDWHLMLKHYKSLLTFIILYTERICVNR
jgi:hypothetical protein